MEKQTPKPPRETKEALFLLKDHPDLLVAWENYSTRQREIVDRIYLLREEMDSNKKAIFGHFRDAILARGLATKELLETKHAHSVDHGAFYVDERSENPLCQLLDVLQKEAGND